MDHGGGLLLMLMTDKLPLTLALDLDDGVVTIAWSVLEQVIQLSITDSADTVDIVVCTGRTAQVTQIVL